MKNSIKLKLDNLKTSSTVKHLRGRHDQRDHAWNRGMGRADVGGRLGPGYMNESQFRAFVKSLDEAVAAGDMTQEENDTIRESVRAAHNQAYDKRINEELSRRESTVETLANRRRNRTIASPKKNRFTAADVTITAANVNLANIRNYRGTNFSNNWASISNSVNQSMSQEDKDFLDQKMMRDDGEMRSIWSTSEAGINTRSLLAKITNSVIGTAQTSTDRYMNEHLSDYLENIANVNNFVSFDDIASEVVSSMNEYGSVLDVRTPSQVLTDVQKNLDNFIKHYKKLKEFNWNPNPEQYDDILDESDENYDIAQAISFIEYNRRNYTDNAINDHIEKNLMKAELLRSILQPAVIKSVFDVASATSSINPIDSLGSNQMVFYSPLINALQVNRLSYSVTSSNDLRNTISQIILPSLLKDNTKQLDDSIMQEMLDTLKSNVNIYKSVNQSLGHDENQRILSSDMYMDIISNSPYGPSYLTRQLGQNTLISSMATTIRNGITQKIGHYGGGDLTSEQKDILKSYYSELLNNYYGAVSQYSNNNVGTIDSLFGPLSMVFTDKFWSDKVGISDLDQIELHQKYAEENNAPEFATQVINTLQIRNDEQQIQNMDESSRIAERVRLLERQVQSFASMNPSDDNGLDMLVMQLDDARWQQTVANTPDFQNINDIERLIAARISLNQDQSPSTTRRLRREWNEEVALRRNNVLLLQQAVGIEQTEQSVVDWINAYIESAQRDGNSVDEVSTELEEAFSTFEQNYPAIDLNRATEIARAAFSTFSFAPISIDYDSFKETQEKTWDGRTPKLITIDGVIQSDDSVFSSPAFAYGNPIADPLSDTNMLPPDNPDEVPLFNPRSARGGAREIIEEKESRAESIFKRDSQAEIKLRNNLRDIGYDDAMIDQVINSLNDSLIPAPRGAELYLTQRQFGEYIGLQINYEYSAASVQRTQSPYYTSGVISFGFHRNPSLSYLDNHVNYMIIPNNLGTQDSPEKNKYTGAAAPVLMYSGDQLRRVGYVLGSSDSKYSAQAAVIDKTKNSYTNSGPTTWPVLGATALVTVNRKLIQKLLSMGYSSDFIKYIQDRSHTGSVPSYLFFLNAPPKFYSTRADTLRENVNEPLLTASTPQKLWYEIYETGCVDRGFNVKLKLGNPNDPGRIYNQFIPGSKKKEYIDLKQLRHGLRRLKERVNEYA